MEMIKKCALCAGRHDMPVQEAIFDKIENPLDFAGMQNHFAKWYADIGGEFRTVYGSAPNGADYTDVAMYAGTVSLEIYVTGLTTALTAVLAVCVANGIPVALMHYDRETGNYVRQGFPT